jgi:hypothetical protein
LLSWFNEYPALFILHDDLDHGPLLHLQNLQTPLLAIWQVLKTTQTRFGWTSTKDVLAWFTSGPFSKVSASLRKSDTLQSQRCESQWYVWLPNLKSCKCTKSCSKVLWKASTQCSGWYKN